MKRLLGFVACTLGGFLLVMIIGLDLYVALKSMQEGDVGLMLGLSILCGLQFIMGWLIYGVERADDD